MSGENGQGTAVAKRTKAPDRTPLRQRDPVKLAHIFFESGYFEDVKSFQQAVVKICAGEELGIGPMASMQNIHIIDGKPSFSGNLLATQVKVHPDTDYRVIEHDEQRCEIEFFEAGESVGTATFTMDQAAKIVSRHGKQLIEGDNWKNYPEAMLFNRCIAKGVRMHVPQVTAGVTAFTPEELGAVVNEDGEYVDEPEAVDGEVVHEPTAQVDQVDDTEAQDAEPVIGEKRAGEIYDAACVIESVEPNDLALAISFVAEAEVGADQLMQRDQAVLLLANLTEQQAVEMEAWIERQRPAGTEGEEQVDE